MGLLLGVRGGWEVGVAVGRRVAEGFVVQDFESRYEGVLFCRRAVIYYES